MKLRVFYIVFAIILIGIFLVYYYKTNTKANTTESILFYNTIESNIKDKKITQEAKLLELCKIWGVLKYHGEDSKKMYSIDSSLVEDYTKINSHKTDVNTIISEKLKEEDYEKQNHFIGTVPDKNWIETSIIINHKNKQKLIGFVLDSYNKSANDRLIDINRYSELDFEKDSLFFNRTKTTKGLRFLSLCKIWNIIRYYYPYFEDISKDWDDVFIEMLPLFINAKNEKEYYSAVLKFSTKLKDSHVGVKSYLFDEYKGKYVGNAILKTIEERNFVKNFVTNSLKSSLKKGDEVLTVNGIRINTIQDSLRNYVSGSNETVLNRDINKKIFISKNDKLKLTVIRNKDTITITEKLTEIGLARKTEEQEHKSRASQVVSKIIDDNIGYINMSHIFSGNFRVSIEKIKECKAIIFDLRSYPNEIGFNFLKYFDIRPFKPMNLYRADISYPGLMKTIEDGVNIPASKSNPYSKPVIILTNEFTQSQAESMVLAMHLIKNSVTIGDYTAGTNGNVVIVSLPGKIKIRFSGIGVLMPNHDKIQRHGIKPDIIVKENINSLTEGRDIQLEKALNFIKHTL